MTTQTCDSD